MNRFQQLTDYHVLPDTLVILFEAVIILILVLQNKVLVGMVADIQDRNRAHRERIRRYERERE